MWKVKYATCAAFVLAVIVTVFGSAVAQTSEARVWDGKDPVTGHKFMYLTDIRPVATDGTKITLNFDGPCNRPWGSPRDFRIHVLVVGNKGVYWGSSSPVLVVFKVGNKKLTLIEVNFHGHGKIDTEIATLFDGNMSEEELDRIGAAKNDVTIEINDTILTLPVASLAIWHDYIRRAREC